MVNKIESLKTSDPAKFFKKIKKLGAKPGETQDETFGIKEHIDDNLSPSESVERIAEKYSSINKKYPHLIYQVYQKESKRK